MTPPVGTSAVAEFDATLTAAHDGRPAQLASALCLCLRKYSYAEINAIGPSAVNVAVKAIIYAREYLHPDGYDLTVTPQKFTAPNRDRPDEEITGVRMLVRRIEA